MNCRWLLVVAIAFGVWAGVAPAQAQLRLVVLDFRGPQSGQPRAGLVRNLQNQGLELVSREEVEDTALELGIRRRRYRQEDYAQLAQVLQVDAFLRGVTRRARRRWALTVIVVGADGVERGRASWGGRTVASLGAIRRNGYARLEPYLSPGGRVPPQQQQQTYANQQGGGPWWAGGQGQEQAPGATAASAPPISADDEEEDDDGEPVVGEARQSWLSLQLMVGSLMRSMAASAEVASPRNQPASGSTTPEERTYESAGIGHMEVGIEAVFWPGAFEEEQRIPWFGVVGSARHSLFLTSFGCERRNDPADPCLREVEVPTTQSELYVGVRGRYRVGEVGPAPEVSADLGFGQFTFELDPAGLMELERPSIIPPLAYTHLHLGVAGSYPVVPRWLTVGARAAYRVGLGIGQPAQEVWGVDAEAGGGFLLGLEVRSDASYVAEGVYLGLDVQYFQFTTTYRGQTACVDPGTDGVCYPAPTDPPGSVDFRESWEPWPHAAGNFDDVIGGIADPVTDGYVRISLAIGYTLR